MSSIFIYSNTNKNSKRMMTLDRLVRRLVETKEDTKGDNHLKRKEDQRLIGGLSD